MAAKHILQYGKQSLTFKLSPEPSLHSATRASASPAQVPTLETKVLDDLLLALGVLMVADDAEVLVASGSDDSVLGLVLHVLGEAVAQWPSF